MRPTYQRKKECASIYKDHDKGGDLEKIHLAENSAKNTYKEVLR